MKVWVLNLDAEIELSRAGPYQAPERVLRALAPWAEQARSLFAAEDQPLETWLASETRPAPAIGACWSPTPAALRRLAKAGVPLPPAPGVAVLRNVSHRRFYLGLGGGAPGAAYFESLDTLDAALAARGPAAWLFKRPYGFAGRGQRRIGERLSADDRRWLADGVRLGGLLGEPWLPIERELCLHGVLDATGGLRLGRPCEQRIDAFRAWASSSALAPGQLAGEWRRLLRSSAERAAEALHRAGYFGPFGIDAYLWRTPGGGLELNPLGELNARYTMGFSIGMSSS